jgi:hypothetical protein
MEKPSHIKLILYIPCMCVVVEEKLKRLTCPIHKRSEQSVQLNCRNGFKTDSVMVKDLLLHELSYSIKQSKARRY